MSHVRGKDACMEEARERVDAECVYQAGKFFCPLPPRIEFGTRQDLVNIEQVVLYSASVQKKLFSETVE